MSADLKRRFLKMLKEDEMFRHAVMAHLGIEDIRTSLNTLTENVNKLTSNISALTEAQKKLTESLNTLTQRVDSLEQSHIKLTESLNTLTQRVDSLEQSHIKLTESLNTLTQRVDSLEQSHIKLTESLNTLTQRVDSLAKEVGSLSSTIGFGLEDIAKVVVPGWLYRHEGIEVELGRKIIYVDGEEIDLNLYGEGVKNGKKIVVIGEAKHKIYGDDVKKFHRNSEKARKVIKGEIYKLMFGFLIHPSAEKEAEKRGIRVIASYMR
jgi:prefoldin subunit 5